AQQIPSGLEARAGRWRDHVAGKKILLLLDDAAGHEQVRPLLPGTAGSLVLITSRRRLSALGDAAVISPDALSPGAAGRQIAAAGGSRPLALRIPGARVAAKPHWRVQRLADRLAAQHRRLDELAVGDLEVRASFALSYQAAGEVERRAFRLLGLLEVPDF